MERCAWANSHPLLIEYHDKEWGVPVYDDHILFENLILETFSTGLSWLIVLKKRDAFEKALAMGRPVVIECQIDSDDKVWPMVAPGAAIEEVFSEEDLAERK